MSIRALWKSVAVVLFAGLLAGCAAGADGGDPSSTEALSARCAGVRCPMPLCVQGQHLSYRGGTCCPQCVADHPDHCADTACPGVLCVQGDILVTNDGECCGRCVHAPAQAECTSDADCPQLECFACPCPVTTCQGRQCVSQTPSESTCALP